MPDVNKTQLFLNYSLPLTYVERIAVLRNQNPLQQEPSRRWLSQPRRMDDDTWEVLTISFRSPVSVSQISFELYEISQQWEFWYFDRQNRRLPILDQSLRPFSGSIGTGDISQWYVFLQVVTPIVATKVEFRIKRVADQYLDASGSYSLGVRNLLFKRNVYSRQDAIIPLGNEVDPIGNLVENFIKDWDSSKAVDGIGTTFWKSAPQPDPNAVVCFYMDCKDSSGNGQRIDRLWLNPVYTGQAMNLYYSNDDTVGKRSLNSTFVLPVSAVNAPETPGSGLDMTSLTALYKISATALGIQSGRSVWFGAQWAPNFASNVPPAHDLMLFQDDADLCHIKWRFASNSFEVKWGTTTSTFSSGFFNANSPVSLALRIVFPGDASGVASGLYFDAVDASGTILSRGHTLMSPNVVPLINENLKFAYNSGFLQFFFIKQEGATDTQTYSSFQDMESYVTIDGSDSTINMVFGANFLQDEAGYGGLDNEYFASKEWTPMWVDWTVNKGFYYFPLPITCKFIKLEFTGLTEEQYPIYETGIQVEYKTFPLNILKTSVSVLNEVTDTFTTNNSQTSSISGVLYNNYYQSSTYNKTVTLQPQDLKITIGKGTALTTTPQMFDAPLQTSISQETASSTYYRSSTSTNVQTIAADQYYTVVSGDYLIKIGQKFGIDWHAIYNANAALIAGDPRVGLLPHRSVGWWIFPGQVLRIPASIMNQITTTSTNTEKKVSSTTTTTTRTRFSTTQVHQYDVRKVTRDAAIAYFAGLNEVKVYKLDYTALYDNESYIIPTYDSTFTMTNMQTFSTGAWKRLNPAVTGQIVSSEWDSMSFFQRLQFIPYDRGLYRQIAGTNLSAISVGAAPIAHYWNDPTAHWNDSSVTWEEAINILNVNFQSNQYFAGKNSVQVTRPAGYGSGGIQTTDTFAIDANARVRIGVDYFLTNAGSPNPIVVQLYDTVGAVALATYKIPTQVSNQWVHFDSPFYANTTAKTAVVIRFLIQGSAAESVYVADLYPQTTSVLYEASNDGGVNYFDITSAAYNPGSYFMFPTMNRKLKFRITLYDPLDFCYGFTAQPSYMMW